MNTIVRLQKDPFAVLPENKVLKADDYLALSKAREIIHSAEVKAQERVCAAKTVYAAEKQRGYQEGVQTGKTQMSEQIIETTMKSVDYLGGVEKALIRMVMTALRKIIGEFDDETLARKVVRNALQLFTDQRRITLRIAPCLQQAFEKRRDGDFHGISCLNIVADHRLAPGSCILESEIGVVDASVETQLAALESALVKRTHG